MILAVLDSPFGGVYQSVENILTTSVTAIILLVVGYSMELNAKLLKPCICLLYTSVAEYWWSDDPVRDPWRWRIAIAKRHDVLYGKFFAKKAGFISKKWLPVFANYRRDGYDFDALFEDEKAPIKHKNIMKQLYPEAADTQIRKILK